MKSHTGLEKDFKEFIALLNAHEVRVGLIQFPGLLHVEPEFESCFEVAGEDDEGFYGHASLAFDDFILPSPSPGFNG